MSEAIESRELANDLREQANATREQLNQARERDNQLRELSLTMAAYDMRLPISAIGRAIARTAEGAALDSDGIATLARSSQRLEHMIAQLLDFAGLRAGNAMFFGRVEADLAQLCTDVMGDVTLSHPRCKVSFEVRGNTRGRWHPYLIGRVVSNLLDNAVRHGSDANADLVLSDAGSAVILEVSSAGPVPERVLPHLFEPFRRGPGADAVERGGLGLGLYISKQIVLAHGGSIRVETDQPTKTTFVVELPRVSNSDLTAAGGAGATRMGTQ